MIDAGEAQYDEKGQMFYPTLSPVERDKAEAERRYSNHASTVTYRRERAAYIAGREDERAAKGAAYEERNKVVAALARLFPSGIARTDIPGWEPEWHGCVYIDLPTGQTSWHFHDSQAYLFAGLPPYAGSWDGHDTDEKYRRLAALAASTADGWKLTPRKATHLMCGEGAKRNLDFDMEDEIWEAMWVMAPSPPPAEAADTIADLRRQLDEAREVAHYANGVAELAMKHRDIAERALDEARAEISWLCEERDMPKGEI